MSYSAGYGGWRRRPFNFSGNMPSIPLPPSGVTRIVSTVEHKGLDALIATRFARAPFVVVIDVSNNKVINVNFVQNSIATLPHGAGVALGQWLISIGADMVLATRLGPNVSMVLQHAGIKVKFVPPGTKLRDAIAGLGISI